MSWMVGLWQWMADDPPGPVREILSAKPRLPAWSPYLAVGFGALAGATFAARRGFDIVGVLGLAVAQGMGGLLLQAILLQTGAPPVLTDGRYLGIVVVAGLLGFFFGGLMVSAVRSALLLDALSLGLLCAIGTNRALAVGLSNTSAVFIGLLTAVGGLILRDIMAGRAPEVLRPGIWVAAAALIGALVFVGLVEIGATRALAQMVTLLVVTFLRLASARFGWVTHEAMDLSDRVWHLWDRKPPDQGPDDITQAFDRHDR